MSSENAYTFFGAEILKLYESLFLHFESSNWVCARAFFSVAALKLKIQCFVLGNETQISFCPT